MPTSGVSVADRALPSFPVHNGISKAGHPRVVFDVGMNNGDDSAYYLSQGFRVVAIEANPVLVEKARGRFEREIANGQLSIEGIAISDEIGKIPFWINEERTEFSSVIEERARRNGMRCRLAEIEGLTFETLLERYGVPYYLKLDIEGAERFCLESLRSFPLPSFISVEAESLEYQQLLWQLGYREFAIVDQMRHNSSFPDFDNETVYARAAKRACWYVDRFKNRFGQVAFPRGSSGPCGADTRARWQTFGEVAYNWLHLHFGHYDRGTLNRSSWYDFHARATTLPDAICNQPEGIGTKHIRTDRQGIGRFDDEGIAAKEWLD
jgi:FkbM family methyltransferase